MITVNMINCRRLDRHFNIFTRMFKNPYLLVILCIMVGGQAIIVNFGGAAFQVTPLGGRDWAISIIIGLCAIPWGMMIRCLPTETLERWAIKARIYPDPNRELPMITTEAEEKKWGGGIQKTIDNLQTYSTIRGGRLRASSIIRKSRTRQLRDANISPTHLSMSSFQTSLSYSFTNALLLPFLQWLWFLHSFSVQSEEDGDLRERSATQLRTILVHHRCTSTRTDKGKW